MFKIIIDTREQKNLWSFHSNYCEDIIRRKLDTGDYSIEGLEHLLCLERKATVAEFAVNMRGDTFKRELARMQSYKYKFIIFEFGVDDILRFPIGSGIPKSKWESMRISPQFIMRFISEIQVIYGVHVVFAGDGDNAKYIASNIMKRVYEQEHPSDS
jgi:ERCC4-type nuclease